MEVLVETKDVNAVIRSSRDIQRASIIDSIQTSDKMEVNECKKVSQRHTPRGYSFDD